MMSFFGLLLFLFLIHERTIQNCSSTTEKSELLFGIYLVIGQTAIKFRPSITSEHSKSSTPIYLYFSLKPVWISLARKHH